MVSAEDIHDEASLRAWLEGRPRQDAMAIAVRAAWRVAPLFLSSAGPSGEASDRARMSLSRLLLIAAVLGARPRADLQSAAAAAARTFDVARAAVEGAADGRLANARATLDRSHHYEDADAFARAEDVARSVAAAARAASGLLARDFDAPTVAVEAAFAATYSESGSTYSKESAAAAASSFWRTVASDAVDLQAGRHLYARPLWPEETSRLVPGRQDPWRARGGGWVFWADLSEGYRTGRPLDIDLLAKVAEIKPEDWDKGETHVNGMIEVIYRDWQLAQVIRQNPYAVTVSVDARQQKLVAAPVEPRDLAEIVKATRAALRDFERRCAADQSHNRAGLTVLSMTSPVLEDLKRDLTRYRKFPVALFEAIEAARNEVQSICVREGLSQESAVARLSAALQTRAQDVCVADPAVLETVRKRMDVELALLTRERIDLAVRLCRGMGDDSAGWLKDAARLAVTVILDPGRSEDERRASWYFIKAVVPRGAQAVLAHNAAADAGAAKRSRVDRVADAADRLAKIDKGADVIQEAIADNSGWVGEVFTYLSGWASF